MSVLHKDRKVEEALGALPKDLDATYVRILEQIAAQPEDVQKLAYKCLTWVLYAKRPLTVKELQHAVAVNESCTNVYNLDLDEVDVMISACANLLVLEELDEKSRLIRPVHYSVQEFLTKRHTGAVPGPRFEGLADEVHSHESIASCCMSYLQMDEMREGACESYTDLYPRLIELPLAWYASTSFDHHFLASGDLSSPSIICHIIENLLRQSGELLAAILQCRSVPEWPGLAHKPDPFASFQKYNFRVDASTMVYATKLHSTVGDELWWTSLQPPQYALHRCCLEGDTSLLRKLLDNGAQINELDYDRVPALYYASMRGHNDTVRTLLQNGADVNTEGGEHGNALNTACYTGFKKTAEMLLSQGADVNALGGEYGTALQAAAFSGNAEIVELLLSKGANVNAQYGEFGNALHAASAMGRNGVVEILLRNGADINAKGPYGNAIEAAKVGDETQIVAMLEAHLRASSAP